MNATTALGLIGIALLALAAVIDQQRLQSLTGWDLPVVFVLVLLGAVSLWNCVVRLVRTRGDDGRSSSGDGGYIGTHGNDGDGGADGGGDGGGGGD